MSDIEKRKIKIKNNKNKLRKIKIKKYSIVFPLFVTVLVSILLMFTIPDFLKGNKLGTYVSSESSISSYELRGRDDNLIDDAEVRETSRDYIAYIIFSYVLNTIMLLISVLLGFHYYIKFTNEIDNFERYKTLS